MLSTQLDMTLALPDFPTGKRGWMGQRVDPKQGWKMEPVFQRRPVHHPQAISQLIEDQTLILKLDTGRAGLLNKVGSQVWELMDGRRSLGEIVEAVGRAYDVDRLRVEGDVTAFVQALLERDMLTWAESEN
jgi:hypothetical protein